MAEDVTDSSEWNVKFREDEEMDFFTELALHEAERWIQAVTRKKFEYPDDFRKSLSNGILLCDLLNGIKPGSVKRINKLSGAIAGLDNIHVFLTSCERNFGLNQTQLFDPSDLEDLSQRAIADEDEELLRQEVDRRAINVAVTIFWLGKSVAGKYKGPLLDTSAFSALVHSHGNKNVISDDHMRNHDNWNQDEIVKQTNQDQHRHARDSSYDSLGSYERESECSFDELDGSNGTMPVRSDMRGDRRYGSTSSLSRDHELRLSAANDSAFADDKHDSMYQSSPDLSQGSHAHTRSSSTDSLEGSYHGNHSRQSSGSADNYPTRRSSSGSAGRKSSTSDPLQFVKISKADKLAEEAARQIKITEEANKMRGLVDTGGIAEEPDWQSNFEGWKKRRKSSTPLSAAPGRISEAEGLFGEDSKKGEQPTKTFSQIMEAKNKRKSLGAMHFYPIEDELDGADSVKPKASASTHKEKKPKDEAVAPWARDSSGEGDSQSDSETNQSHQSGDTDSVFSDKSAPNKVLSDDDSWVKNNSKTSSHTNVTASKDISVGKGLNVKSWENSVQASTKKSEKKPVDLPSNSANKIKNLTQSFEQKEKAAHEQPAIQRRADFSQSRRSFDFGSKSDNVHPWKSTDLSSDKSQNRLSMPDSSLSPTSPKALLPKNQRYGSSSSPMAKNTFTYSPPAVNTKSFSASPRSRYIDSLTPPHTPKSSPLTTRAVAKLAHKSPTSSSGASTKPSPKPSPPPTLAKPPRGKLAATISKFESAPDGKKTNFIKDTEVSRFENQLIEGSKDVEQVQSEKIVDNESSQVLRENKLESDTDVNGKGVAEVVSPEKRLQTLIANDSNLQKDETFDFQIIYPSFPNEQTVAGEEISDLTATRNPSEDVNECEGDKMNKRPEVEADFNVKPEDMDKYDNINTDAPINTDAHSESVPTTEARQMSKDIPDLQKLEGDITEPYLKLDQKSNSHSETFLEAEWRANGGEWSGHNIPDVIESIEGQAISAEQRIDDVFPIDIGVEASQAGMLNDDTEVFDQELQDDSVTGDAASMDDKKFVDKTIKISQKANNSRGFGFMLVGGAEKKQPVTVQRVNLGSETSDNDDVFISDSSAADVCEVEMSDTILKINGRDVTTLTLAQVQGIVDHSVKRGQIELVIRRYQTEEEEYDSMEEEEFVERAKTANNNSNNSNKAESDTSSLSTDITSEDTPTYKPAFTMSSRSDDNSKPRIMDQLMRENDAKNNQSNQVADKPPSPIAVEPIQADISFSSHMAPKSSYLEKASTPASSIVATSCAPDTSSPDGETITEERATLSAKKSPTNQTWDSDNSPVVMRRKPVSSSPGKIQKVDQPSPPILPRAEPPPLPKSPDTSSASDDSSFGPPAALLRWQRGRAKSEYQAPFPRTSLDEQLLASKKLSSTLPYQSDKPLFDSDYSRDDSALGKASKNSDVSVPVSKSYDSKRNTFHFDDSARLEAWQNKQEKERQNTPPPVEVAIQRVESLTPQNDAPVRKVGQVDLPSMMELSIPSMDPPPLSPQEKFERDQQRIRQKFEEEKRQAQEVEKKKKDEEQQVLNQDRFIKNMESQIVQTKLEATNQSSVEIQPLRPVAAAPPRFSSEPMTIRLPGSSTEGRHLVIDPRNQGGQGDAGIPEYSFHVDLKQSNNSAPPLRTLAQATDSEQLERERIREEEKEKIRQEMEQQMKQKQRELDQEQERLHQERERLQQEQEQVAQEKAQLEQRRHQDDVIAPRYQTASFQSPRSSSGSAHSPHSPQSPAALNPKHRELPMPRKMDLRVPPPTAPKPDRKEKGRLTREDLMAMNRKATPMTNRPEGQDSAGDNEHGSVVREAPSKDQLHSLNAVPKQKFRNSAAWIKDEEEEPKPNERQFVIGSRSDVIHKDYSNPDDHWLIREAEKRRLAEQREKENRYSPTVSVTARAGPTKPSESALVSRFRSDVDPVKRNNRYSYPAALSPDSHRSMSSSPSRPLSSSGSNLRQFNRSPEPAMTQFSAKTQPNSYTNLSQTLPQNFSFSANSSARKQDLPTVPSKSPHSPQNDGEQMIAVSGKQTCSHCGEELEGLKYSKV